MSRSVQNCCTPAGKTGKGSPDLIDESLAVLAKALGHPLRVEILRILLKRDSCVCGDIVEELPRAQSTVSQHLKVLKDAGLIRGEIDGPRVCYCIDPARLKQFKQMVNDL